MPENTRYQSWDRLLHIIEELQKGPQTASGLADSLKVHPSMVRRDLAWLSERVEEIVWERIDRQKHYRMTQKGPTFMMYPAAFALLLGNRATKTLDGSEVGRSISDLLEDASSVWGSDAERKIFNLPAHFKLEEPQHESLDLLVQALREERWISMEYQSPKSDSKWENLRPLTLVFSRARLYLVVASDEWAGQQLRRLDRIRDLELIRPKRCFAYPSPKEYNPAALFEHSFGPFLHPSPPKESVVLRFFGEAASFHRHYDWPVPYHIRNYGTLEVELKAHIDQSLRHFIMRLGKGVEVVHPKKLRDEVRDELRKALKWYS